MYFIMLILLASMLVIMYFIMHKGFTWPLSGFAASGITFYTIDFLNTLDTRKAYDGTGKEEETQD